MNRRSLLKLIGVSPAVGPFAAKAVADAQTAELAGIGMTGLGSSDNSPTGSIGGGWNDATPTQIRSALSIPAMRSEITSILYQEELRIFALDSDLASKKSFSLAAKITFQRRRNVKRRLSMMTDDVPLWRKANALIMNFWAKK